MDMNKFKYAAIFALFSSAMSSFAVTDTSTPEITITDNISVSAGNALHFGTLYNDADLSGTSTDNTIQIGTDGSVTLGSGITTTTEHVSVGNAAGDFAITGAGNLSIELSHSLGHASVVGITAFVCNGSEGITTLSNAACNVGDGAESDNTGTISYGATLELDEAAETPIAAESIDLGTITIEVTAA